MAVVQDVVSSTGYKIMTDDDVVVRAAESAGESQNKMRRAFSNKTSVFNRFTHEKECAIAQLRLAVAELIEADNLIMTGFTGLLIPSTVSHALRVCLIADIAYRIRQAFEKQKLSEKEALKNIRRADADRAAWVDTLFSKSDPWDSSLYDIVIPMDKVEVRKAGAVIEENILKDVVRTSKESEKAARDFKLASQTDVVLCEAGHNVDVKADDGAITLTINKHVLMLSRLEEELKSIAEKVPGVTSVQSEVGKGYHQSDIYRKHHFETPSKVLLVDDEREFVQTLSERLQIRDMGSAIAYDGESAMNIVSDDEPDVMIIDLKMPGINGVEVLKRVKKTRPEIEVIVLTGHGSDSDKQLCIDLGAFAYMQKPVDIDLLSDTIKEAYEKIRRNK
jgi:CheY-like chemotaxis protein